MKQQQNIARRGPVIWAQYELKLTQLDILFQFVLHAFLVLSEAKRKEFVQGLKLEQEFDLAEKMERLRKLSETSGILKDVIDEEYIQEFQQRQEKKVKAAFRSKTHRQYAEWVMDGMISAEILFRFTVFEDFMKHVHAAILCANTRVFATARPKRQATYEEIFSDSFDRFKEEQICREVGELDRQSIEQKINYFAEQLGVDLSKYGKWLIEISDIRNKIAHGNPLEAITKDDTTLPLQGLQGAIEKIIKDVMRFTFEKCQSKYPRQFLSK